MPKGWISFTIEALHDLEETMFNFLEQEFEVLEVDHSMIETSSIVRLLLKDPNSKWFVPTVQDIPYDYLMAFEVVDDIFNFKITLLNETKTDSN